MKTLSIGFLIVVFFQIKSYSQTVGISYVRSLEAKALIYDQNKTKISQIKSEIPELERLWRLKIQKVKDEISALIKERDALIADMKVGARCSQCNGWKSDFEKKGENFEKHLGDVKGYAVPATTSELEATRKQFAEKIAIKKVQLQNLEKGDEAIHRKLKAAEELEKANVKICKDMTELSKSYEESVFTDAKSKHELWTKDLLHYATNILIADDKITIFRNQVIRYEKEFQKESEKVRELVKKENQFTVEQKNNLIATNEQQINTITETRDKDISINNIELKKLYQLKSEVDKELSKNLLDSIKSIQTSNQKQIVEKIATLEKSNKDHAFNAASKIAILKNTILKLKEDIFQLNANLPKVQELAILKIKLSFDQKKSAARTSENTAVLTLASAKKLYLEKTNEYKKKNDAFTSEITTESNRMLIAGQKISCPIWNQVRGMVFTNWNQVFPCVNNLTTMAKPYSTNVFNAYCSGKSLASYMSIYKSFLMGLSKEDREVVKANSNAGWYDQLTM